MYFAYFYRTFETTSRSYLHSKIQKNANSFVFCSFNRNFVPNMKEFVISEAKAETAVLVGLITKEQDEAKTKEYLDELEFLADTAGAVTVKRFTQKVGGPSQTTYVGSGKLQEIKQYIKQCQDAYDDWLDQQDAQLFAEGLLDETPP